MLVRDAVDGTDIDQVLLVREVERRIRRDGGEFLRLTLGDRTGHVVAMVWDDVREVAARARVGDAVRVVGRIVMHPRYGAMLNLRTLRGADHGSYAPEDLSDGPARAAERMEADLRRLISTVHEPHLR